jgi:hypothetical protein
MTVHVDLVEGNEAKFNSFGIVEKSATIRVLGLARTLGADDLTILALEAAETAGYVLGSEHPSYSGLLLLCDRTVRVISPTAAEIPVVYRSPGGPRYDPDAVRIRGRVTLVSERTNQDITGADLYTEWKESAARPAKRQLGTVDKGIPCVTLQFNRGFRNCPFGMAKNVVGYRNSDTFQNDAAGLWLVTGYDFSSDDGGDHWEETIEVTRNARLWKQTIYYLREDGQIPSNWDAAYNLGNTVKLVTVYGNVGFAQMELPTVS